MTNGPVIQTIFPGVDKIFRLLHILIRFHDEDRDRNNEKNYLKCRNN